MGFPAFYRKGGFIMLKSLKKLSDIVDKISLTLASIMVSLILFISIYGAFFRYVLQNPLPWTLPVSRILMIWSALFGIAAALKRSQHMSVEVLITSFPKKVEKIIRYIAFFFVIIFIVVLFWYGFLEVVNNSDTYMISATVRISSKWLVAAIPVSALLQLIHLLPLPLMIDSEMSKDEIEKLS